MFKLDEAAEGKSVQNPGTMLKLGVVYECHFICSIVLGASRKVKDTHECSHVISSSLFSLPVLYI